MNEQKNEGTQCETCKHVHKNADSSCSCGCAAKEANAEQPETTEKSDKN